MSHDVRDAPARTWHGVWQAKGTAGRVPLEDPDAVLRELMEMNGYFSATSTTSLADHEVQLRYIVDSLGIRATDSVYEVGCGAGALLYWLRDKCAATGGCDFAESLVAHARRALPGSADLRHCEARETPREPRYDVVLSNGVFIYFPDETYAREVLTLMLAKARRAVGVFDVNDADRRAEFEAVRRARHAGQPQRYDGLEQLYLPRGFFTDIAREHGFACRIEDSTTPNSANARFRYHATLIRQ
ncbi:MAG: class I SAM-dependent methyltransferase [Micromonosporaceae bacterium]